MDNFPMGNTGRLKERMQALALLDAILEAEWEYRYYSFNSHWNDGEEMGSMRDGCGTEWFCLFKNGKAWLTGRIPGQTTDGRAFLPFDDAQDEAFWREPAFATGQISFGLKNGGSGWQPLIPVQPQDLSLLDALCENYTAANHAAWVRDYYETEDDITPAVQHLFEYQPINPAWLVTHFPEADWDGLAEDLSETAYPVAEN